mmetsp:Transcript_124142/g.215181  ORF Transcript_124142/g.215181 Transcript_124142/m.215181 type:complete len:527 (+) Transcript_124142:39-1619(+)
MHLHCFACRASNCAGMTVLNPAYLQELGLVRLPEAPDEACIILKMPQVRYTMNWNGSSGAECGDQGGSNQQAVADVSVESLADTQALNPTIGRNATDEVKGRGAHQEISFRRLSDADLTDVELQQAFDDALASALTKFDSLEAYFASGMLVPAVCEMLTEELQNDKDFTPAPEHEKDIQVMLRTVVGKAYGAWKKGGAHVEGSGKIKTDKRKDTPLPWSSIDAYPEWVVNQIENYGNAPLDEQADARSALEFALLEKPLCAASIKYDGTCFGKMDTGALVGRKSVLGSGCDTYQHTSTAAAASCNVAALRSALSDKLAVEVGSACVWGELMCNPNFYGYKEKGLFSKWLCFGVVADLSSVMEADSSENILVALSMKLNAQGFAYSLSSGGKLRLMLCPALRQLLRDVAGCEVVDDHPQCVGLTHAEVVAQASASLRAGENEGLVLVFTRPDGQSSVRKWKNSAEGATVSFWHAALLRRCKDLCMRLISEGKLDARVAQMVESMLCVAKAKTSPQKKGRSAADKAAV